ncbi:MAG TPA: MFS transporter [Candidatus Dormibacteraeota bacterium]|nr:MFS transporter [Candidatus Dormibacteraeota bacterium]
MTQAGTASDLGTGARWTIVGLLAAALFINYIDRGAVPTAAHLIQDDLGFSPQQLGLLMSAFWWLYALLQFPVGWLVERFGAWRLLGAGLALWACATMLVGVVHSFGALLALRLLLGVGESVGFPSVSKLLATVVPVERIGLANGIVAFGYLFGPAVGTLGGGMLMASYGWRSAFWVFGALSLLWLLPWSRVRLPAQPVTLGGGADPPMRALLKRPELWGTSLGLFSVNYAFYFTLTWLPFYVVREHGFSTEKMAGFTFLAYLVHALSGLAAGWLIDRVVARRGRANLAYKAVMGATHVGFVACMVCIALAPAPWALAAIFAYQVLDGANSPGVFGIPQILAGPRAAGRWVGIQNGIGNFAGVIAPALTGFLVGESHHFTSAFLVAALVSVLGVVGWVLMIPKVAPLEWPARRTARDPGAAQSPASVA